DITQRGVSQTALVTQDGSGNESDITQGSVLGGFWNAGINVGEGNTATVTQTGTDGISIVTQSGDDSEATLTQSGLSNESYITQSGSDHSATVMQTGTDAISSIT